MTRGRAGHDVRSFWRRCLIVSATTVGTIAVLWFIWAAGSALLLIFAAFLVAVALDGLARGLSRVSGLARRPAVLAVALIVLLLLGLATTIGTINISSQAPLLKHQIAQSIDALQSKLKQYHITEDLLGQSKSSNPGSAGSRPAIGQRITQKLTGALTVTLSTLIDLFLMAIIGLYLALNPNLYYRGLLRLFPPGRQRRVDFIAHEAADAVRRWLTGRAISMTLVGICSIAGLWLIGINFPVLLGILAGILTFIPYLGPLVSAIPALLVAGLQGLWPMIYVAILYLALHILEGYFVAPLIQRRAASIAPAFLLSAQVIGGAVAGIFGIGLAAPLALVFTVIIQLGYVQDVIGEEPHLPSGHISEEV
jgi:predicted PurR-regulated permease PerM